jgi:type I restriction enzyme S subunit
MELRPGYKQTEVGVIPEDWDVKAIDELAKVTSGKRMPPGTSLTDRPNAHPYIRISDMVPGSVRTSDLMYVPEGVFPAIKRFRIFSQDIFISVAGSLDIVGKVPKELSGANLTENADRITDIACSQDYLLYFLMSPQIQGTIDAIRTVGAQPKLALSRIRKFKLAIPKSHDEQNQIAECLHEADHLLGDLDLLVTKKRLIKQAAMQELLTGKRRLPGFEGEWEEVSIGGMVDLLTGFPFPSSGYSSSGVRLLRGSNVKRGLIDWNEDLAQHWPSITSDIARYELRDGDIVIAMDGALVGRSYARVQASDLPALLLQRVARIRSSSLCNDFLFFQIGSSRFADHCDSVKTSTAIPHISPGDIRNFKTLIPPTKNEQIAIATILLDLDAEISGLETRLNKARELKQGMMQQLLTGKIRLT